MYLYTTRSPKAQAWHAIAYVRLAKLIFIETELLDKCFQAKGFERQLRPKTLNIELNNIESGLKSPNTTVSTKITGIIGLISKVSGDRFAANYLFRADSIYKNLFVFQA